MRSIDAYLAIVSKRDTRSYADRPVPEETVTRILDAGRLAGSAKNRQPWRFLIVRSPSVREQLAGAVYEPTNVRGAAAVIAVAGRMSFDVGRSVQNMMLAAWNEGVASCPNGIADAEAAQRAVGLEGEESVAVVLTFGYPARGRPPESRTPSEWSARADRRRLAELVAEV
jgi:nitroreductase